MLLNITERAMEIVLAMTVGSRLTHLLCLLGAPNTVHIDILDRLNLC